MIEFLRKLKKPRYQPVNQVEILGKNLVYNYNHLKSLQNEAKIWPVLKSNAYGHGITEVCKILNETDCSKVCVDSYPEAQIIYKKFKGDVLIIGEMALGAYAYCNFKKTEFVVYNKKTLSLLASLNKKIKIHLFVNTGMSREGLELKNLPSTLDLINKFEKLELVGLCSHMASADDLSPLNLLQEKMFWQAAKVVKEKGFNPTWFHLGNSAGVFFLNKESGKKERLNAFRPGFVFYGYNPFKSSHFAFKGAEKLKPTLRVVSTVVAVRRAKKGQKVSYNETLEVQKDTNLATIPFGYYEGLDRGLSNKAIFKVVTKMGKSFYVKIAGRVCMNLTVLDCSDNQVKVGDKVEIVSEQRDEPNSANNLAEQVDTIAYEVLVRLQGNIRRKII